MKNKKNIRLIIFFIFLSISIPISLYASDPNTIKINGIITDNSTGESLIGVSVVQKGTTNGAITDIDGDYTIEVPAGSILVITYIGYQTQEIEAKASVLDIKMKEDSKLLDEVVVVGYGVQKKSVTTASIGSVKGDDLDKFMPTRVDNLLKGMVSGVNITQNSGQPGEGSKVSIRGTGTINNSNPLYIVDGMAVGDGIDYLNPADIESIEVLKDAASAAIYGARAANGVILVTTKKGKAGKATITYNVSYGWQNPWRKRKMLNATQYATVINEMLVNDGGTPLYSNPESYGKGTNWQDEVFNSNAPIQEHQVGIAGGSDKGNYYLSFGYFNQEGIVGGNYDRSNYERYTIRLNNNYTLFDEKDRIIFKNFKIGTNVSYARTESTGIETNSEMGSPLGSALAMSPIQTVYDQDPQTTLARHPNAVKDKNGNVYSIAGAEFNEMTNPLALLSLPGEKKNTDKIVGNFWGELEIYENLKFRTSYGVDLGFSGLDGKRIPYYLSPTNFQNESAVWSNMERAFTWLVENTLSYTKTIEKNNFTILLGQSAQSYQKRILSGTAYGLSDLDRPYIDGTPTNDPNQRTRGRLTPKERLASYFGRLSYNYDEKYIGEFTIRRDGSSNFGPNNKWATFPSVSAGWNITNEKFMENRPNFLTSLKLRASWGKNGNQAIDAFRYTTMMVGGNDYILGPEGSTIVVPGYKPNGYPNKDIKWEESVQTDIGFDSYLLGGAITFSFDWYTKKTNGMLMELPLPSYIGNKPPIGNVGSMRNSGVEFDASYRFSVSDVNIRVGANATYLKNELLNLGNDTGWQNYDSAHGTGTISRGQNGQPFPFFYGYKTDGIFQSWDEVNSYVNSKGQLLQPDAKPGDVRFVDTDGDGTINDSDRVKIGKGMPDWTFGFNIGADWRGFDLNMSFSGSLGNDIYDASRRTDLKYINLPEYMLDRWTGAGTSNHIPRLTMIDANQNWRSSDLYVKNGSYLRLRNIQLGYTIPKSIIKKAYIENLRFYVNAENLLTFTSYQGFDPEISSGGTSLGIDKGVYPQSRTFSIGANITF